MINLDNPELDKDSEIRRLQNQVRKLKEKLNKTLQREVELEKKLGERKTNHRELASHLRTVGGQYDVALTLLKSAADTAYWGKLVAAHHLEDQVEKLYRLRGKPL